MDQGISQNRLKQSLKRHQKAILVLVLVSTVLFGVLNVVKQMKTRAADEAALEAYQATETGDAASQTDGTAPQAGDAETSDATAAEESSAETPQDARAERNFKWANLQVDYYDSRVNELIDANQEVADYLSDSLLKGGDLRNMPSYQIMTKVYALATPITDDTNSALSSYTFRAIDRLYQTERFYDFARQLVGRRDISEIYIDELMDVGYDPVAEVVNVKAFHPDPTVAEHLANLATEEIVAGAQMLGMGEEHMTILESARRESMTSLLASRQQLLRDMKTNQDELTLLQGQEPPKVQQKEADQDKAPTVRAFSVRSFVLYLAAGFLLGVALSILLVVLDLFFTRDQLMPEDFTLLGITPLMAWSKKDRENVLTLHTAEDLSLMLSRYFDGAPEQVALLIPEGESVDDAALADFTRVAYPTDGRFALPELPAHVRHVAVLAPKRGMKQQMLQTLEAGLSLLHHSIDLMILR